MNDTLVPVASPRKESLVLVIEPERCKGCGFCVEFCPRGALALATDVFNAKGYLPATIPQPDRCTACRLCEMFCPDFAIYLTPAPSAHFTPKEDDHDEL